MKVRARKAADATGRPKKQPPRRQKSVAIISASKRFPPLADDPDMKAFFETEPSDDWPRTPLQRRMNSGLG
jgi:hypothetical protein